MNSLRGIKHKLSSVKIRPTNIFSSTSSSTAVTETMKELEEPNVQNLTKLGNQKSSRFIKQFLAKNGLERLIDQLNSFQEIGMYHKTIENLMILGVNAIENIFLEKQGARYFLHQIRGTGASVTGFCRFVQGTTPVVRAEIYSTLEKKIKNCVRLVSSVPK